MFESCAGSFLDITLFCAEMVMGMPLCCEKMRGPFFFFLVWIWCWVPMSSPSPLRVPEVTAFAMTSEGVGLGSSGCI